MLGKKKWWVKKMLSKKKVGAKKILNLKFYVTDNFGSKKMCKNISVKINFGAKNSWSQNIGPKNC